ncbi:response regulator [Acidobacteria bacterium AB60]|nr:response regulator [Acidobacteria bacterium AB60]
MFDQHHASTPNSLKHCLIVDDSPTVRKVAARILRGLEIEVEEAPDGQSALETCRVRMPQSILLDWNMPVMTGIEFLRNLRRMDGGLKPKVIMCTTQTDVEHVKEAFDAGADEYIMKPFDAEILSAKVLRCFEGVAAVAQD